jgi:type VI secretion system secreted protein Hcp
MRRVGSIGLAMLILASLHSVARAAEPVFLRLKIQGAEVKGDVALRGVEGMIECSSYEQEVTMPVATAGLQSGRRQYQPLKITKRIDQSSPQILKALTQNEVVDAEFHFYRVNRASGAVQQFYTVEIKQAHVVSVKQMNPDRAVAATAALPPMEEVSFAFNTIKWTYVDGGITHEDAMSR